MELHIDRVRCAGHGVCRALLPAHIDLDEWGYPVLHHPGVGTGPDAVADARRAAAACPALALRVSATD